MLNTIEIQTDLEPVFTDLVLRCVDYEMETDKAIITDLPVDVEEYEGHFSVLCNDVDITHYLSRACHVRLFNQLIGAQF